MRGVIPSFYYMTIDFNEIKLTSNQILERISEKTIYEHYLNKSIGNKLIKCCFHKDSTPSLGFYKTKSNNLYFNCFGCGRRGNVFEFVQILHNCDFGKSLNIIQNTFKLSKNDNYDFNNNSTNISTKVETIDTENRFRIIPTFRNWKIYDFHYWNRYHISLELLDKFNIKPCSRVYNITKQGEYIYFAEDSKNNPIYCYSIDDRYKIYRPLSLKEGKWATDTTNYNIQGLAQLPNKGELLIITSSMKDILVLKILGYTAIALGGESNSIPESILNDLYNRFDNIIIFFDNDEPGLKYSEKLSKQINTGFIHIPVTYSEKDISDYVEKYGILEGKTLMNKLL